MSKVYYEKKHDACNGTGRLSYRHEEDEYVQAAGPCRHPCCKDGRVLVARDGEMLTPGEAWNKLQAGEAKIETDWLGNKSLRVF